jgi:TPR repeat protein
MGNRINARLKSYVTFPTPMALLCLALVCVPSLARASPDPCSAGYKDGSSADVDMCANLAQAGGPNAEFGYALILWSGHNRPEDHKAALDWFRKSARQGHYLAQTMLGMVLSNPSIEKELRNPAEAYAWFVAAGAEQSARKLLANMSASDAEIAKRLGNEYRSNFAQQRPTPGGP